MADNNFELMSKYLDREIKFADMAAAWTPGESCVVCAEDLEGTDKVFCSPTCKGTGRGYTLRGL